MPGHSKYSFLESVLFPPTRLNTDELQRRLVNKTILITGASYGIGECLAYRLAGRGVHLVLVARTVEKLQAIKSELEQRGGEVTIFPTDLTNDEQVKELISRLSALPNGIDIAVNNAGKSIRRSIFDSLDRYHDFTRTMALNYLGPVQLLLSLVPTLQQRGGQIINISAVNVLLVPAPRWAAYQASKSAFDQWFRSVGPELNAAGICTTSIYLPLVRTRMIMPTTQYDHMPAMSPDHVARIICRAIMGRTRRYAPWWLMFGQLGSLLFRTPWEYFWARQLKKESHP